jgi:hypothetical protein
MPSIRAIPGANPIWCGSQSNGTTPTSQNGINPDQKKFDPVVLVQLIRSHPQLSSETKHRLELLVRATASQLAWESSSPLEPMVTPKALQEAARDYSDRIWATGDVDLTHADPDLRKIYQLSNFDECDLHWLMQIMSVAQNSPNE